MLPAPCCRHAVFSLAFRRAGMEGVPAAARTPGVASLRRRRLRRFCR